MAKIILIKAENAKKKGLKIKKDKNKIRVLIYKESVCCMIFFAGWVEEVLVNEEPNQKRKKDWIRRRACTKDDKCRIGKKIMTQRLFVRMYSSKDRTIAETPWGDHLLMLG